MSAKTSELAAKIVQAVKGHIDKAVGRRVSALETRVGALALLLAKGDDIKSLTAIQDALSPLLAAQRSLITRCDELQKRISELESERAEVNNKL
jgi:hypothetical protein